MATEVADGTVVDFQAMWSELDLPPAVREVLSAAPLMQTPETGRNCSIGRWAGTTGTTDWRLGNREDHGVYEAVSKLVAAVASSKQSSPRRAMAWPSTSLTRQCAAATLMRW